MKICCISAYFGPLPNWFEFFVASINANPQIDWLVFNDREDDREVGNVKIRHLSFDDFRRRVSDVVGESIVCEPYKTCDYKPLYGRLFEKELSSYDFWGFGDLDFVLGDLEAFIPRAAFADHDILTCSARQVCGVMTFLRNQEKTNNLFLQIPGIHRLLADKKHYAIDEIHFDKLVKEKSQSGEIRVLFQQMQFYGEKGERVPFRWENGKIWMVPVGREGGLVHFASFRQRLLPPRIQPGQNLEGIGMHYTYAPWKKPLVWSLPGLKAWLFRPAVEWVNWSS
jgi:hypothetical protein